MLKTSQSSGNQMVVPVLHEASQADRLGRQIPTAIQHGPNVNSLIGISAYTKMPDRTFLRIIRFSQATEPNRAVQEYVLYCSFAGRVVVQPARSIISFHTSIPLRQHMSVKQL
jgi:hypothetical protein